MKPAFTIAACLASLAPALVGPALAADRTVTLVEVEYVEYYEEGEGWVADGPSERAPALARFGPFEVVAPDRVALVGDVDSDTPGDFRRMLAAWPGLRTLDIVECGGTMDDAANLALARMIRRAGLDTHVPAGGSVRSGGVELFIAGVRRSADPGAEFIVHAWLDDLGREANEVPIGDPAHAAYLAYYRDMGLSSDNARGFYALTNSAPHDAPRQLSLQDLARFNVLD